MNHRNETIPFLPDRQVEGVIRAAKKHVSAESKVRIVLEGLRGQTSISTLCRREGIAERLYYNWSKEFIEAGQRRLSGDLSGVEAMSKEKKLQRELRALKEVLAEQALELHELRKIMAAVNDRRCGD